MRRWALSQPQRYFWMTEAEAHDVAEVEWPAAVAPCICAEGHVPAVLLTKSPEQMHKMSLHCSWLLQPLTVIVPEGSSGVEK